MRRLVGPLGRMLATAARDALGEADPLPTGTDVVWLIPVPARPGAARARGADHMSILAGRAARELRRWGIEAHRCRALVPTRPSLDQLGLTRQQRLGNVHATMRAAAVPHGRVVVVDDVTTTGATLREAVRALSRAGCRVAAAASVTHAQRSPRRASGTCHS